MYPLIKKLWETHVPLPMFLFSMCIIFFWNSLALPLAGRAAGRMLFGSLEPSRRTKKRLSDCLQWIHHHQSEKQNVNDKTRTTRKVWWETTTRKETGVFGSRFTNQYYQNMNIILLS